MSRLGIAGVLVDVQYENDCTRMSDSSHLALLSHSPRIVTIEAICECHESRKRIDKWRGRSLMRNSIYA